VKTIQVRDVPTEVHARLRRRAAQAGVSLSDYVRAELEVVARRGDNAEILMRAAARDAPITIDDIHDAVREHRRG
jgi:plasmid stability protein